MRDLEKQVDSRFKAEERLQKANRDAIDIAIQAVEKTAKTARKYGEKALTKAEAAGEKRWEGANEFRQSLEDQATHLATKEEVENRFTMLSEKYTDLAARLGMIEGRDRGETETKKSHLDNTSMKIALGVGIISFFALAIGVIGLFIALYHKA